MTKFSTPCLITTNSPETRGWLETIGYLVYGLHGEKYLFSYLSQKKQRVAIGWNIGELPKDAIDCRGNLELFKALAALREDNDWMQWMIIDKPFAEYKQGDMIRQKSKKVEWLKNDKMHKATPQELTQHFKNK